MRKPVLLAVLGISIVVAAGTIGMTLSRYLSLRAYAPKAAARPAAAMERTAPILPPEQWTNLFAPAQGMKLPSRVPPAGSKPRAPLPPPAAGTGRAGPGAPQAAGTSPSQAVGDIRVERLGDNR